MRSNRSIPNATVIPQFPYPDLRAAAAWLERAFGCETRLRIGDHRIQMHVGEGAIVLVEGDAASPKSSLMVRVPDARAHHARAAAAGAQIVMQPTDFPFGERQYSAIDCNGHGWTFTETIADVDPASWGGELVKP